MTYNSKSCDDEEDAARMAQVILRALGYINLQINSNVRNINDDCSIQDLLVITRNAERISRWARKELKRIR